ncbi:hypothetical protein [Aquimarina sediminis]|nr:hypothetical protein [Aquimarina sediminis]
MKKQNKKKVGIKKIRVTQLTPKTLHKIQGGSSIIEDTMECPSSLPVH